MPRASHRRRRRRAYRRSKKINTSSGRTVEQKRIRKKARILKKEGEHDEANAGRKWYSKLFHSVKRRFGSERRDGVEGIDRLNQDVENLDKVTSAIGKAFSNTTRDVKAAKKDVDNFNVDTPNAHAERVKMAESASNEPGTVHASDVSLKRKSSSEAREQDVKKRKLASQLNHF